MTTLGNIKLHQSHRPLIYPKLEFPLSSLILFVNLLRLDLLYLTCLEYFNEKLQSVTMPKIREFLGALYSTMLMANESLQSLPDKYLNPSGS